MTQEQVLFRAQFTAIEVLVELLLSSRFSMAPDPAQEADRWLLVAEALGERMTFSDLPPAMSDLMSQEFRDALLRRIHRARAIATGQPFDPGTPHAPAG